ncbi:MAG: hypothetical protein IIY93_13810, partial [Clostridia bacterium]|nr:hypothetical protein [Clostridia bacterium]
KEFYRAIKNQKRNSSDRRDRAFMKIPLNPYERFEITGRLPSRKHHVEWYRTPSGEENLNVKLQPLYLLRRPYLPRQKNVSHLRRKAPFNPKNPAHRL